MSVAKRLNRINPSEILSLVQKVTNLSAPGYDITDLGIGESDFQTSKHVIQAACHAMQNGEPDTRLLTALSHCERLSY